LYAFLIYSTSATCSAHLVLLDVITLIVLGESYKLWSSSLCTLLQPFATFSLVGPKILFSTLLKNILNVCSSLSMKAQISPPYNLTGRIIVFFF
jgi:hypothetical protein